ncbi:AAA family ATPase [Pseudovibrio sp. Ad46]|uniref:AAA family ATPase n=1 Tax=Pseudovibrio sp. Ad46 TaxID=989432 RepID=UPI0007AE7E9A|nr:AAA family ATPase [Pseudovibrio sp. Ad46]
METVVETESPVSGLSLRDQVLNDLDELTSVIEATAAAATEPEVEKVLRPFQAGEVAELIGITRQHLTRVVNEMELDLERVGNSQNRVYTLEDLNKIRKELASRAGDDLNKAVRYDPQRRAEDRLAVTAFANFKGGSAKTTSSVHFAIYLALKGYRVLFLDMDQQGSASTIFGYSPILVDENDSINAALRYDDPVPLKSLIKNTYFPNIDIALGGMWMSEWETDTPRVMTEANFYEAQARAELVAIDNEKSLPGLSPTRLQQLEQAEEDQYAIMSECLEKKQYFLRLRRILETVEEDYDVVVCDTQPSLHFVSQTTIGAADHLFITIQPEWLDIKSMQQYLSSLAVNLGVLEENAQVIGDEGRFMNRTMNYLITRYEARDATQSAIAGMMRHRLESVLDNAMPRSAAVSQAGLNNRALYEGIGDEFNRQTYKRGLEAMNAVNSELLSIVEKGWDRNV